MWNETKQHLREDNCKRLSSGRAVVEDELEAVVMGQALGASVAQIGSNWTWSERVLQFRVLVRRSSSYGPETGWRRSDQRFSCFMEDKAIIFSTHCAGFLLLNREYICIYIISSILYGLEYLHHGNIVSVCTERKQHDRIQRLCVWAEGGLSSSKMGKMKETNSTLTEQFCNDQPVGSTFLALYMTPGLVSLRARIPGAPSTTSHFLHCHTTTPACTLDPGLENLNPSSTFTFPHSSLIATHTLTSYCFCHAEYFILISITSFLL